jgi:outer membrane protein assembly factor BamB
MRSGTFLAALVSLVAACSNSSDNGSTPPPTTGTPAPQPSASPAAETAIVTNLYDNARSGATANEKVLVASNVNKDKFGLLFSRKIEGFVYGHVLYVPGLTIKGAKHNVIFAGTQANMVYAFDADDPTAADPLWSRKLAPPMPLPIALTLPDGTMVPSYPSCQDLKPSGQVGITSTPVIDPATKTMYVVSKTNDAQRLYALDITTGDDLAGSPATITGMGFTPTLHLNRPGLLLQDGAIYIAFGSHCDDQKTLYHGWIFAYDAKTLQQKGVYNTTPAGQQGAIWQSGVGLTGDGKGGVLATVGNGDAAGTNMGFSVIRVKLTDAGLTLTDHYTPPNTAALAMRDLDLATGVNLLPGGTIIAGGKEGYIYVLDDTLKTKITANPMTMVEGVKVETNPDSKRNSVLHMLTVWNGPSGPVVYTWPTGGGLTALPFSNGMLGTAVANNVRNPAHPGGSVTVSSDGTKAGTGIVWATIPDLGDSWHETADGKMYAFDASDVNKVLWSSDMNPGDNMGKYAKFSPPVVANGRVYVASFDQKIVVYGPKK